MHEWALAEAVIQTAIDVAKREGFKKVTLIKISLGELQGIEREIFDSAISGLLKMQGNVFVNTKVEVNIVRTKFRCRACEHEWTFKDISETLDEGVRESIHFIPEVAHSFMRCPKCGSPDFEVLEGRGISVTSITGEK